MLGASLLLGAVVNVAVAWGCAIWLQVEHEPTKVEMRQSAGLILGTSETTLVTLGNREPGAYRFLAEWNARPPQEPDMQPVPGWVIRAADHAAQAPDSGNDLVFDVRGWPSLCLYSVADLDRSRILHGLAIEDVAVSANEWFLNNFAVPTQIIWPGFAVNTLFYAVALWLLIRGPFALRRLVRRRRGLCPACGYDLQHAEHESCPECGAVYA